MTGTSDFAASSAASMIAVSCGTPTPATTRVVQIEPGPMPTLIRVRAGIDQRARRLGGGDVAGDDLDRVGQALHPLDRRGDLAIVAMRGVDHDQVAFGVDQRLGAREALVADRGRGGDAQAARRVLGRGRDR